jgi:hypothetical protein
LDAGAPDADFADVGPRCSDAVEPALDAATLEVDSGLADAAADAAQTAGRLEKVFSELPTSVSGKQALAVDRKGHVYFASRQGGSVLRLQNGQVCNYLSEYDMQAIANVGTPLLAFDIDYGSDDALYVLVGGAILRSTAPRQGTLSRVSTFHTFDVITSELLGGVGGAGMTFVAPSGDTAISGLELVFSQLAGCALADYAMAGSGVFLYQPGCNGTGIERGNSVMRVATVFGVSAGADFGGRAFSNSLCLVADPRGGFYALLALAWPDTVGLFHLDEDVDNTRGFREITTTPRFDQAASPGAFFYCSMAVAPDGSRVYVQTGSELWRVTL